MSWSTLAVTDGPDPVNIPLGRYGVTVWGDDGMRTTVWGGRRNVTFVVSFFELRMYRCKDGEPSVWSRIPRPIRR